MSPTNLWVLIGVLFIGLLLVLLYFWPAPQKFKKIKKDTVIEGADEKDWKSICLKLEKHIVSLREQVASLEKNERIKERALVHEQEKGAKLLEKLAQERRWREKETDTIDKRAEDYKTLKQDLAKAQEELEKEYGQKLRLENEIKELKKTLENFQDIKRSLESQQAKLESELEYSRKEINKQKGVIADISKKHDETSWVAKSEYVKLEKAFKEAEKELTRFKDLLKREVK